jgi:hypothetical protein
MQQARKPASLKEAWPHFIEKRFQPNSQNPVLSSMIISVRAERENRTRRFLYFSSTAEKQIYPLQKSKESEYSNPVKANQARWRFSIFGKQTTTNFFLSSLLLFMNGSICGLESGAMQRKREMDD